MTETFPCPAFTPGPPGTSGDLCGQTCLSGKARYRGCPLGVSDCNAITQEDLERNRSFNRKWAAINVSRRQTKQNLIG